MIFRRALLGLKASEVELHIQGLEAQLNEKGRTSWSIESCVWNLMRTTLRQNRKYVERYFKAGINNGW